MMNQIKHGLAFLFGLLYASCIWLLVMNWSVSFISWLLTVVIMLVTLFLFASVIKFLILNWKKK